MKFISEKISSITVAYYCVLRRSFYVTLVLLLNAFITCFIVFILPYIAVNRSIIKTRIKLLF